MEVRRMRRFGRRQNNQTLLPLRVAHLSNTVSCWYCDFKSSALNDPLLRFGRRYSRYLRVWFSIGIGFCLATLSAVTLVLLWELASYLYSLGGNNQITSLLSGSVFGYFPTVLSLADAGYICLSTIISVSAHELGHAIAATRSIIKLFVSRFVLLVSLPFEVVIIAFTDRPGIDGSSEGMQIEYIAVFLAILFPGALVAFNHEVLQALPRVAALRIYCAGIWHNAVFCAVCALALFLLPLILYPTYTHSESPMVLDVLPASPLFGYLSPGDFIVSLDGMHIHDVKEWMMITNMLHQQATQNIEVYRGLNFENRRKGYCVPSSLIEESDHIQSDAQTTCPDELFSFVAISCLHSSTSNDTISGDNPQSRRDYIHCLNAKDIVELKKCGDGWMDITSNGSSCSCSEEESCLTPLQMPGLTWTEITYARLKSLTCQQLRKELFSGANSSNLGELGCGGSFVFIGDVISMAHSVSLTVYQPRWSIPFGAYLPVVVEKLLKFSFHVSLMLALLNSLPVYFLDGESILEGMLPFIRLMSPRQKDIVLQSCLLGGTCIATLVLLRNFFLVIL